MGKWELYYQNKLPSLVITNIDTIIKQLKNHS